jgi:arginyl-tRNA synthetase
VCIPFDLAINDILRGIKTDLSEFGVEYQQWFCEQTLVDSGLSEKTVKKSISKQIGKLHQ